MFLSIVTIAFFIWAIRNILFWVGLWQDKEYRRDRLIVHFKETMQGKHIFFSLGNFIKWLFFFAYILPVLFDSFALFYELLLGFFFILQAVFVIKDLLQHRIKRPVFTLKASSLCFFSFLFLLLLYFFPLANQYIWLLVLDRIIPLVVGLFIFFFSFPTEIYHDVIIQKAFKKIQNHTKIMVIAVSGSYGKSSTKEFIGQMLAEKFLVVKTVNSINTPIGIANTILQSVTPNTEVFIVEMGTDKKGDNEKICKIVRPDVSITTSVSDQHLSTFKSMQTIFETEMELIHALPKDGLAVFNGDSIGAYDLYKKTKKKKVLYATNKDLREEAAIWAENITVDADKISFDAVIKEKRIPIEANVLGRHMIENILPAVFIANYLGIPASVIKKLAKKLLPPPKTMTKKILSNGVTLIDDTFNASPESVIAALNYLPFYKARKFFVMTPLIELSTNARDRHYQIGTVAASTCDILFLLNKNFSEDIIKGVLKKNGKCQIRIERPETIVKQIKQMMKKGDVIIFEGKESKMVMKFFL
jgi:UDP-N-acetylmuramoyl-tripeptide--D-alanyl-D-alanine ligase